MTVGYLMELDEVGDGGEWMGVMGAVGEGEMAPGQGRKAQDRASLVSDRRTGQVFLPLETPMLGRRRNLLNGVEPRHLRNTALARHQAPAGRFYH